MQTTLRIHNEIYREAKVEAARSGVTLTQFIEEALKQKIESSRAEQPVNLQLRSEIEDRDRLMEALLERTAHFRIGEHPTRDEMNAR